MNFKLRQVLTCLPGIFKLNKSKWWSSSVLQVYEDNFSIPGHQSFHQIWTKRRGLLVEKIFNVFAPNIWGQVSHIDAALTSRVPHGWSTTLELWTIKKFELSYTYLQFQRGFGAWRCWAILLSNERLVEDWRRRWRIGLESGFTAFSSSAALHYFALAGC